MRINNNIASLNANRNLANTNVSLGKSLEKLSSGFRINRAADDAAGLAISEGLRSEIRGSVQAQRNAQDGISFIQTAEGALNEVHDMLQRMRELAVQAANSTSDGTAEQAEARELAAEISAIGARTTFNGQPVFGDFATTNFDIQVSAQGLATTDYISIATDYRLDATGGNGITSTSAIDLTAIDLTTDDQAARDAVEDLDAVIDDVSTARADLGATQNRLEHVVTNLGVAIENLTASESRIRDTDMATEMTKFTKAQILSQAGTSMLAQANAVPQNILALLR